MAERGNHHGDAAVDQAPSNKYLTAWAQRWGTGRNWQQEPTYRNGFKKPTEANQAALRLTKQNTPRNNS